MNNFNKISLIMILVFFLAFGLVKPAIVQAATAPDLGTADGYSVFGKAGVTNTGAGLLTHIWGNVGADLMSSITGLLANQVDGTIIAPTPASVQTDITAAYGALAGWPSNGTKDLSTPQIVTPGVYEIDASQTLTGDITLSGAGVYIFRSASAYHVANGARVLLINGATPCNVFWTVQSTMTIGTTAEMVGTIIADTEAITLNTSATLKGRAFSTIAAVTLLSNQITEPTCSSSTGTINVVKTVINDNGRTNTVASFPLFVNGTPVISGDTNAFSVPATYIISETANSNYIQTFSGDCDSNGSVSLALGENKFCIITNNDKPDISSGGGYNSAIIPPVPPLIDVVKVPNPLSLPNGPGYVDYSYTLRNIGTVPVTNITMVGDTCSPITLTSGDTNTDSKLDVTETWVYNCSTMLSATHTNTIVATGWANGLTTTDIASATVIVGMPIVPPLIHITKVPSSFALPIGGGTVIYTKSVTNPGTVALSNVQVIDDQCGPVKYISGDINTDSKLDITETWTYTCQTKLTQTTTNTATVTGEANGLTARDFAIATVVVAAAVVVPQLPNTGLNSVNNVFFWSIIAISVFGILILFYFVLRKKLI